MKNGTTTTASRATIVTATDKSGHEAGKPEEIAGEVASSYASNAATTDEAAQQQPSFHDQSVGTTTHSSADESVKLIGWDGDDDPENPKNLPFRRRWFITSVISLYGILSPMSSSMIAPCIPAISSDLHVTGSLHQNMMVSVFMLGYVVGPFLLGPLSEIYGRRPLLMLANFVFVVFTVGCSRATTFGQLVAFRLLSGLGGSGPITVGGGILGDLWRADERGRASALYALGPLLGPSIGPIVGGWIIQKGESWRWIFYILIIVGASAGTAGAILLPETYAPVLIQRKVQRLRDAQQSIDLPRGSDVEKAQKLPPRTNVRLQSRYDRDETFRQLLFRSLVRPIILLSTQPIVMVITAYQAILLGIYYILIVTYVDTFRQTYHENVGIASLNYLALALGSLTGRQGGTFVMDRLYRRLKARNGGVGTPEMRIILLSAACLSIPTGMIIFGWAIQYRVHWIVANLGGFLFTMGMVNVVFVVQTYTIDVYTLYAASALAASNSVRSIFAFGFPLFATTMFEALGHGWGCTLLGLLALFVGGPGALILYFFGPRLRARSTYATGE